MEIKDNFVILTKEEYQLQLSIIDELRTTNEELKEQNAELKEQNVELKEQNGRLEAKVIKLEARVKELEARLHKNSGNSQNRQVVMDIIKKSSRTIEKKVIVSQEANLDIKGAR
jgi:predicted nuclease with TOPRIM domain